MKIKLLLLHTLLLVLLIQPKLTGQIPFVPAVRTAHITPGSATLSLAKTNGQVNSRSVTCDTLVLNFPNYNYVYSQKNNLYFNGDTSLPSAELTSFVDVAHNGYYNVIEAIFDTIAYVDANNNFSYYPLSTNTVTLDTLAFYIGIHGSQFNMTNDSLVLNVFSITDGILYNLDTTLVYQGYNQLLPFVQNPGYVTLAKVGVGHEFMMGQGFAIEMSYLNKDTSTHCVFTYAYADSCGTIPYLGNYYSSPAYPAPLGVIAEALVVQNGTLNFEDNLTYFNGLTGVPQSCTYIYEQNFDIFPFIHVCPSAPLTPPIVQTNGASGITQTSATLNGTVNASSNTATTSFYYGLTTSYGANVSANPSTVTGSTNTPITSTISGLSPFTTYHYVAAATVNGNTTYGSDSTFTTVGNLAVTINKTDVTCFGDSNGIAIAMATQGNGYAYQWSNGRTSDTISGLAPGPYSVTVSANGQTATATINISQPHTPLSIIPTITNVNCYGQNTGSISVMLSGGTSPYYFYHWSNISANVTKDDSLTPGNYMITATDSRECTVSGSYSITQNPSIDISVTSTGSTGSNGTATAHVTGGVSPYTYNWSSSPAQTDSVATGLAPGSYTVTATDSVNCTASASIAVQTLSGIAENGREILNVSLFPNPATELLQVIVDLETSRALQMNITDITGKLVYAAQENAAVKQKKAISLSQFSSGVYILEVATQGQSVHQKFMVIR